MNGLETCSSNFGGTGPRMRGSLGRVIRMAPLAAACALAACTSSIPDFAQFKLPDPGLLLPSNSGTYVPPASARAFRPVVPAIGQPQSVNISANERGDCKVLLVYAGNERAGTYEFVGGRLNALERGPE